jgi:hypothetical protein
LLANRAKNHSIFEQHGRILKQNRAKLRMPGSVQQVSDPGLSQIP